MRLINAEKIERAAFINPYSQSTNDREKYFAYDRAKRTFLEQVKRMPTIDPESLRPTAHWQNEDDYYGDSVVWLCSACKNKIVLHGGTPEEYSYNYCPNCGARMEHPE